MATSQTYLVLIKDGKLALAVGAALEDRLSQDGRRAVSLVPATRGADFIDSVHGQCLEQWQGFGGGPLQVVALYEEGLLERLKLLGLAAYVAVPLEED